MAARRMTLALAVALLACGCADDSGSDATPVRGMEPIQCGNPDEGTELTCEAGQACCAELGTDDIISCEMTCPDDTIEWTCEGPSDCDAGYECCGSIGIDDKLFQCWPRGSCPRTTLTLCESADDCPSSEPCCFPVTLNGNSYGSCSDNDILCL